MKKTRFVLSIFLLLCGGSRAGVGKVAGTSQHAPHSAAVWTNSLTGTVIQPGDKVVVQIVSNKKITATDFNISVTGGAGAVDGFTKLANSSGSKAASYVFYTTAVADGTLDIDVYANGNSTARSAIYVLRADSGVIAVADTLVTESDPVGSLSLNYSFTTASGFLAESFSMLESPSGGDPVLDAKVTEDKIKSDGTNRRVLTGGSFSGESTLTTSWNITGATDTDRHGAVGVVFVEVPAGPQAPVFISDPVIAPDASTNESYSATLADYASDANDDPMTFWKTTGPAWLNVASNGVLTGVSPATTGLNSWVVFVTDGNGGTNSATLEINVVDSEFSEVPLSATNLYVQGAKFTNIDGNGMNFHRFDFNESYSNVNTVNARTTSGVKLTLYTRSDTLRLHFDYAIGDEYRNSSKFTTYQNGTYVSTPSVVVPKDADNEVTAVTTFVMELTSQSPAGELVRHDVVLPNYANPILSKVEIKAGKVLESGNPIPAKKIVVLGDSISHGTGQATSDTTYPYIAADLMDVELFNMAVGGGKIAPEVADLLQYFEPVEAIWVLIGYNDWQGSSKTVAAITNDYESLLATIRTHQPDAELFCSTLVPTSLTNDLQSGVTTEEVRQAVRDVVNPRMTDDTKLHLVEGPSIATIDDTGNGIVHFSTEGAARVATNVVSIMDPVINPPFVPQTSQTNIVMIVIDDLGWMDLSIQGSQFYETPRIDALAASGMRFTQGYAAHPRCLPSRYGLMTGRFPGANGVPGGPENNLRPSETTIAEALQANGYETAFMGKWHLVGTHGEANLPQNQGFDINISGGKPGAPKTYFHPYATDGTPTTNYELDTGNELYFDNATPAGGMVTDRITGSSYLRTAARGLAGEYVTDRLTDEALDWMDWNADKPMFLCLWHYGVHTPFEAPAALVSKYTTKLATMDYGNLPEEINVGVGQQKMRQNHPTYAAMIESVDTNIGRLMDKVAELGLSSNTVFIFTSDNGGLSNRGGNNNRTLATANYPLRTGKGWLYEGGIREAFIVSGAGVAAMVNSNAVVTGTDIYPTLLDLAGLPLQPDNHLDGVSFKMALDGSAYDRGEPIFWHSPQARPYSTGDFNSSAVRDGDYKLIWFYDTPGQPYELYNVKTDIGENNDLSEIMPAKAAELLGKIQAWHAGAHDGSGVVFRPDADDVSKPPQTWLDDPTVPLSLIPGSADLDISWGDYLGFNYNVYSKTNLSDATWTLEKSGITASETMLPMVGNSGFYKVESVLQPES